MSAESREIMFTTAVVNNYAEIGVKSITMYLNQIIRIDCWLFIFLELEKWST